MAKKCRQAFVLPPRAIVITRALSKLFLVIRSLGRMFFSIQMRRADAAFAHSRSLAADSAGKLLLPGSERPIASMAVDMVFAVYIPGHPVAFSQHVMRDT